MILSSDLKDKFFIDDGEEILLVERMEKCSILGQYYWIQEDTETEHYDWCYDMSGSISEVDLLERLNKGEYKIIPDEEGFMEI